MNGLREPSLALRVLMAGSVGGGLALVAALATVVVSAGVPCRAEGWGCLGRFLLIGVGCLAGAAVVSWPVLRLLSVRPAFPVTVLGTATSILTGWFAVQARLPLDFTAPSLFLFAFVGFAAAALVFGRGTALPLRIGGVLAILVLLPASRFAATHNEDQTRAATDRYLASAGVPLLAPDLPGYVVKDASPSDHAFRYKLLPATLTSARPGADDHMVATSSINVSIDRLPTRFTPPKRCNSDDMYAPDQSCTAAGPELWRRSENSRSIVYLARKGSVLVTVEQGGDTIDEGRLRQVARTMAPRPASYFHASD